MHNRRTEEARRFQQLTRRALRGTKLRQNDGPRTAKTYRDMPAVALGRDFSLPVVPALAAALAGNPSALVRGHAAWALGRIGTDTARRTLADALAREADGFVREELELANVELSRKFK